MKYILFTIIILSFFNVSFANSVYTVKGITVTSNLTSEYEIKKELEAKAIEQVIRKQVKDIIGQKSYNKNKSKFRKSILAKSKNIVTSIVENKFDFAIPTSTGVYDINLSQKTLVSLLRKNGFFSEVGKKLKILPLISVEDNVSAKKYFWWGGKSPFAFKYGRSLSASIHKELQRRFATNSMKVLLPIRKKLDRKIDSDLKFLRLKTIDYANIAKKFGANAVITGVVKIIPNSKKRDSYVLDFNLKVSDIETFQTLAVVRKKHVTLPGNFKTSLYQGLKFIKTPISKELSQLVVQGSNETSAGIKTFLLKLKGNLKYKQYSRLKKDLRLKIGAVNSLTEKEFKPGSITLELNSPTALDSVLNKIKKSKFENFKVNVSKEDEQVLRLDVVTKK